MRLGPAQFVSALKSRMARQSPANAEQLSTAAMQLLPMSLFALLPPQLSTNVAENRPPHREHEESQRSHEHGGSGALIRGDERAMKAGSRAAARETSLNLAREKFQASRDAFRSALSQARTAAAAPATVAGDEPAQSAAANAPMDDQPVAATPEEAPTAAAPAPAPAAARTAPVGPAGPPAPAQPGPSSAPPPAAIATATLTSIQTTHPGAVTNTEAAAAADKAGVEGVDAVTGAKAPAAPRSAAAESNDEATGAGATDRTARDGGPKATGKAAASVAADSADSRDNIDRILRVLRGQIFRDRSTTVIRMDPPELGYLRLQLDLHHDALKLRIHAETDAARRMLSDDLDALRKGLEAAGLRLEQVEIRPLTPLDGSTAQQPQTPVDQNGSREPRRRSPRESRPVVRPVDRLDAVESAESAPPARVKDSRVNMVV